MTKKSKAGLTIKKEENFSEWYQELMIKAKLACYTKVSGCIVFMPKSYSIWEKIVSETDKLFKKSGIQNVSFPLFIPESLLSKEQEHVKGFTPEVAWVTEAGNKKLNERLAVRPTSESIIYDTLPDWIRSHNDMPLRLNLWNNAVRWEFKNPVPFFRTREFLWNEGHSAFATSKEAKAEANDILEIYDKICSEFMALPSIRGLKTDKEKFAGAIYSEKLHYMLHNGRVIEGPCFHYDGQNFSRAYGIKFLNKNNNKEFVYQNTWAVSTRMLGTMFTLHSDNKGLVIPPKLANEKIVIIPILFDDSKEKVLKKANEIKKSLKIFNPILDFREDVSPGRKFNEWELKGIPLRIEVGPKDLDKKSIIIVKRNTGEKISIKIINLKKEIPKLLSTIQKELYDNANKILNKSLKSSEDIKETIKFVKDKKMVSVPMCNSEKCEDNLKEKMPGLKTLFIDSKKKNAKDKKCIICSKKANYWVYIGRTY
ncbi:MAG: proline--tRNA ligase [Nanoarchaeota archaeon]